MIVEHWSEIDWDRGRWPNFSAPELSCRCCGEYYHDPQSLDMIQEARALYGGPLVINSAHRCAINNARVGGVPLSQHKQIAFDVSTQGKDRAKLLQCLQQAGFTTFGFYSTFVHVDKRPGRIWATEGGKKAWNGLIYSAR